MSLCNANANCNVDSYGYLDSLAYTNGNTYSYSNSRCDSYSYGHCYSNVHGDGDGHTNGHTVSKPNVHAEFVPRADSLFRYRRAAEHAAKPDTGRTGCDSSGPVRRILRHAHAGAVNTVQHRSGLLQQPVC
jgi:hypothetical protein